MLNIEAELAKIKERQNALNAVLLEDDDLGVVIRAHIYIEGELDEFIKARLDQPDVLKALNLDFNGRANLAVGLGLDKDLKTFISCIGRLRNEFAHNLKARLGKQEANNLRKSMAQPYVDICRASYRVTVEKLNSQGKPKSLESLPAKDQVILYVINAWGALAAAAMQAKQLRLIQPNPSDNTSPKPS